MVRACCVDASQLQVPCGFLVVYRSVCTLYGSAALTPNLLLPLLLLTLLLLLLLSLQHIEQVYCRVLLP
jgi:hypothetical protein